MTEIYANRDKLLDELEDVRLHFMAMQDHIQGPSTLAPVADLLESVVSALPDVVYRLDADGRIVFINDAIVKYGYSVDELIGSNFFDLIHPDDRDRAEHRVNERRRGDRSTKSFELRFVTSDSDSVDFELKESTTETPTVLTVDAEGVYASDVTVSESFLYTQGVARDITARKRVERALAATRNHLAQQLAEHAAEVKAAYEAITEARHRDLKREEALGRLRDRILGMRRMSDLPGEAYWIEELNQMGVPVDGISLQFPGSAAGTFVTFYLTEQNYSSDHQLDSYPWVREAWESGEAIFVDCARLAEMGLDDWRMKCLLEVPLLGGGSFAVNREDSGTLDEEMVRTVKAVAGVLTEGLQRMRDFETVEAGEQRYRSLVEDLPVGVVHTTTEGEIRYQNPYICAMLGYSAGEMAVLNMRDLFVRVQDRQELLAKLEDRGSHAFEYEFIRKGGRVIWVRGTIQAVESSDGTVEHHGFMEDVTDRKIIEEEYARLEEHLRQAQRMESVGHLTSGIAHNFNNMLQGIMGNIQLSLMDAAGSQRQRLQEADTVARRAGEMVDQLMMFTRQEHGSSEELNLWRTLDTTIDICKRIFAADPQIRIGVVVIEIDDAAAGEQATPGRYARVSIADNGTGMDEATQRRMFDPFYTTKGVGLGTGLGLATVYGIVANYGGWVECDSELGRGTTLMVNLPLAEPAAGGAQEAPTADAETIPSDVPGATLLVIDDEEPVRSSTARLLEHVGHTVLEASDGREGVEIYRRERDRIDIVLLDLSMPRMSGAETIEAIREIDPDARIVIMTGYNPSEDFEAIAAVLSKPFTMKDLTDTIAVVLRS